MNSDKQGRAMCACGSSGAAPGAEPAAAAPQCRCRTAPRAPSPAQNITAAIAAADLTGHRLSAPAQLRRQQRAARA